MPINIANLAIRISASSSGVNRELERTERRLTRFRRSVVGLGTTFAGAFAGGAVLSGVQSFVTDGLRLAASAETAGITLETLVGNAEDANEALADLQAFSESTPFTPDVVREAGIQLAAFKVEADDIVPTLRRLADASQGNGQTLGELARIYGRVRSAGVAFTQDLDQLTDRAVNLNEELARALTDTLGRNVSATEVRRLASDGVISFQVLEQAIIEATEAGGQFFNLTQRQSQTLAGRISTIEGRYADVQRRIAVQLLPVVERLLDRTDEFLQKIGQEPNTAGIDKIADRFDAIDIAITGGSTLFSAARLGIESIGATAVQAISIPAEIVGVTGAREFNEVLDNRVAQSFDDLFGTDASGRRAAAEAEAAATRQRVRQARELRDAARQVNEAERALESNGVQEIPPALEIETDVAVDNVDALSDSIGNLRDRLNQIDASAFDPLRTDSFEGVNAALDFQRNVNVDLVGQAARQQEGLNRQIIQSNDATTRQAEQQTKQTENLASLVGGLGAKLDQLIACVKASTPMTISKVSVI